MIVEENGVYTLQQVDYTFEELENLIKEIMDITKTIPLDPYFKEIEKQIGKKLNVTDHFNLQGKIVEWRKEILEKYE